MSTINEALTAYDATLLAQVEAKKTELTSLNDQLATAIQKIAEAETAATHMVTQKTELEALMATAAEREAVARKAEDDLLSQNQSLAARETTVTDREAAIQAKEQRAEGIIKDYEARIQDNPEGQSLAIQRAQIESDQKALQQYAQDLVDKQTKLDQTKAELIAVQDELVAKSAKASNNKA